MSEYDDLDPMFADNAGGGGEGEGDGGSALQHDQDDTHHDHDDTHHDHDDTHHDHDDTHHDHDDAHPEHDHAHPEHDHAHPEHDHGQDPHEVNEHDLYYLGATGVGAAGVNPYLEPYDELGSGPWDDAPLPDALSDALSGRDVTPPQDFLDRVLHALGF